MSAPLILFVIDRQGWCFHNIAIALQQALSDSYRFKIMPATRVVKEECDVLVTFWWENALLVKANTICRAMVTCLYDHLSWCINEQSLAHLRLTLRNSALVGVCNSRMSEELKAKVPAGECPPIHLLEDGVDTTLFKQMPLPTEFACGWTGMSTRCTPGGPGDYKGVKMLRAACKEAGVSLRVLDAASGGSWPQRRMPLFYQDVSVQLIGSAYEGTPNPLLEAMAMGRPVITTRVGLADKLVRDGENGFIVDRERGAGGFAEKIYEMSQMAPARLAKMSRAARRAAERYDWSVKALAWKKCLDEACRGHNLIRAMQRKPVEVVNNVPAAAAPKGAPRVPNKTNDAPPFYLLPEPPPRPDTRDALTFKTTLGPTPAFDLGPVNADESEEVDEVYGRSHPVERCQELIDSVDCGLRGRPVVGLVSTHRFRTRTLPLLRALSPSFRFVMLQAGHTERVDVTWSHYPFADADIAIETSRQQHVPFLLTCRGEFSTVQHAHIAHALQVLKQASGIVTLTQQLRAHFVSWIPELADRIEVIPNGAPTWKAIVPPELPFERPIYLLPSNFKFQRKWAGVAELIREFSARSFKGTVLIAAHPGMYSPPEGELSPKVYYLGFVRNVKALTAAADIVIYHSHMDGQPTALLEAMAAGKPVVVGESIGSGAAEFVRDGETGIVRGAAANLMTEALRLAEAPERQRALGLAAQEAMRQLSWNSVAQRYARVLARLMGLE